VGDDLDQSIQSGGKERMISNGDMVHSISAFIIPGIDICMVL
jgi:hypothetical protein